MVLASDRQQMLAPTVTSYTHQHYNDDVMAPPTNPRWEWIITSTVTSQHCLNVICWEELRHHPRRDVIPRGTSSRGIMTSRSDTVRKGNIFPCVFVPQIGGRKQQNIYKGKPPTKTGCRPQARAGCWRWVSHLCGARPSDDKRGAVIIRPSHASSEKNVDRRLYFPTY